jgi:hypothetical protein
MNQTLKSLLVIFLSLCVLIGLLITFAPSFISTQWGNEKLLATLNANIPGKVRAKSISLSWFGAQKIEGFTLQDPQGDTVLSFATLESNTPLLTFLSSGPVAGKTFVKSFTAEIKKSKSGLSNLQESLGIEISNFEFPNDTASITEVDIEVHTPSEKGIKVKTAGITKQGNVAGKFDIDLNWSENANSCNIYADNFPTNFIDSVLSIQNPELSGILPALLGEAINVKIIEETNLNQSAWIIEASSQNFQFHAKGKIEDGMFHLLSPAQAKFSATPEVLNQLSSVVKDLKVWTLASPSEIYLEFNQLSFPMHCLSNSTFNDSDEIVVSALLTLPHAEFLNKSDPQAGGKIKDFSLKIDAPSNSTWISLSSEGSYYIVGTPVKYRIDTKINKPSDTLDILQNLYLPYEIRFSLENLPTSIIDQVLDTEAVAAKAFGDHLTFQMQSSAKNPKELHMSLKSEKVEIPAMALSLDQNILQSQRNWSGIVSIDKVIFPKSNRDSTIHSITIPWKLQDGLTSLDLRFNGNTTFSGNQVGKFTGALLIDSLAALEDANITLGMNGEHIPAALFEFITGRTEIGPVFGSSVNLDIAVKVKQMQGNVRSNVQGTNGSAFLNATLVDKQIHLNEPFVIMTKGSEELGRQVLSQLGPVFNEFVSSDEPIKLTVSHENFSIPIEPFNAAKFNIESAVLEMGKLTFRNSGEIKNMLSSLRPARADLISIWTTPIYTKIQNGVVTVYRTDFLIMDKYPIATWGKIDLVKDDVQMVVGITGTALSHALEIEGLDKNAMVQIPLTGTTTNAKINSTKATAKIGALVAQKSGSPEGMIIGTVLGLAKGKEGAIPPPTTNPLPWSRNISAYTSERDPTHRKNDQREKTGERKRDPIKEIQREASNLLKGFLK